MSLMIFRSCGQNPRESYYNQASGFTDRSSEFTNRSLGDNLNPKQIPRCHGRRWRSKFDELIAGMDRESGGDEGLTRVPFWGLDGGKEWPTGVGGGRPVGRPLRLVFPAKVRPARANGDSTASRSTTRTRWSGEGQRGWAEVELRLRRRRRPCHGTSWRDGV
jgi:hypothetical protein